MGKASAYNVRDPGSIPGSGRSPREENGNPIQYSCQENPIDRGAWQTTVHGVTELDTTEQLTLHFTRKQKRISLVWLEIVILDRVDPDGKWNCPTE